MNKQTKLIVAIALIAALVGFYFYSKKATAAKESAAAGPPVNAQDEADFQKAVTLFKQLCNPQALEWMLPLMTPYLDGTQMLRSENLINGKATKTGAFREVYGSAYYPPSYGYPTTPDAAVKIDSLFKQLKNKAEYGV